MIKLQDNIYMFTIVLSEIQQHSYYGYPSITCTKHVLP